MFCTFILFSLFLSVYPLQECFMDCPMAEDGLDLQGHQLSADCRCWQECALESYTPQAKKVVLEYEKIQPLTLKKVLYVRRDCKDAVLASGKYPHIDDLLEELWKVGGVMYNKTAELPGQKSLSAPKDWVLKSANYHCPIIHQSPYIRRQLRLYRLRALPGRALYFHRDCQRIRYASGHVSAEAAIAAVEASITGDNESLDDWFLYDSSKEGTCSPLTHRVRHEIRSLPADKLAMVGAALNEAYRRGLYGVHAPFHSQMRMYNYAHGTPGFAIWHRMSILNIEEQLRGIHPKYQCLTVPYWDWMLDVKNPKNSTLFTKDLYGSIDGLLAQGHCGSQNDGCCVQDGWFAGWRDMHGRCLSRNFYDMEEVGFPDATLVTDLITTYHNFGYIEYGKSIATFGIIATVLDECIEQCGDGWSEKGTCSRTCHKLISTKAFRGFSGDMELSHSRVHFSVGGHMYSAYSPSDPLFMINHCMVDKVWTRWMQCQGYPRAEDYWVTQAEHFIDAYGVPGPYGLSDRLPGWLFTIREAGTPRELGYTSFSYDEDQWEKDKNLSKLCASGYSKMNKEIKNAEALYEERMMHHLKRKSTPFLQAAFSAPQSKSAALELSSTSKVIPNFSRQGESIVHRPPLQLHADSDSTPKAPHPSIPTPTLPLPKISPNLLQVKIAAERVKPESETTK